MSDWVKSVDRLPNESGSYYVFYGRDVIIRVWNDYHRCWDDEDGDDYFCDPNEISHWMPFELPKPPTDI